MLQETTNEVAVSETLAYILSTKRRHGTSGDLRFRAWVIKEIKALGYSHEIYENGNIVVTTDKRATTMFSCHVDTVHSAVESETETQELLYDADFGHIFLKDKGKSGCLGGDDGVGVYIMLKMIQAKVKGWFVFHVGEETGGLGSSAIASKCGGWLQKFERAVAFDRPVTSGESPEVIISQGGMSCASEKFGKALADELNKGVFEKPWVVSHNGVFTDTKNYRKLIAECVNLGCFYSQQHSPNEYVDYPNVQELLKTVCAIDWDSLPVDRDPLKADTYGGYPKQGRSYGGHGGYGYGGHGGYGGFGGGGNSFYDDDDYKPAKVAGKGKKYKAPQVGPTLSLFDELRTNKREELEAWAETAPGAVADAVVHLLLEIGRLRSDVAILRKVAGVSGDD